MRIYTVEVLSAMRTAILSCRSVKGGNHTAPGHETGGCIEEYHEMLSNLQVIGTVTPQDATDTSQTPFSFLNSYDMPSCLYFDRKD